MEETLKPKEGKILKLNEKIKTKRRKNNGKRRSIKETLKLKEETWEKH